MLIAEKTYSYKAFGLNINSFIELPELQKMTKKENQLELVIKRADLFSIWSEHKEENDEFVVKENFILFQVPEVAIFLVQNGNEINVCPITTNVEDIIRLYILGTCMGAILMQRGILPLHGSAVAIKGKAYAIVGHSGVGKSTLASSFVKRGNDLISDDVIPVSISEEGIPIVTPAYPQQKLWLQSLNYFGMESEHYRPIVDRETKFAIPVSNQFATIQLPLTGIIELVKDESEEIKIYPINEKLQQIHILFKHTYRNFFIHRLNLMDWHFQTSSKILSKVSMHQIHRPISRFTADELVIEIIKIIEEGESK